MSLRTRTLIIIFVMMTILIAAIYAASSRILMASFEVIEKNNAEQDVERALRALEAESRRLGGIARDWGSWDDAYEFLGGNNPEFVAANLNVTALLNLQVNQLLYINQEGRIAAGFAANLNTESTGEIAKEIIYQLSPSSQLVALPDPESEVNGALVTQHGLLLVAVRPVLTGENEGPARGALLTGIYLDAMELERLQEQTRLEIDYYLLGDPALPTDIQRVQSNLTSESGITVQNLSNELIAGYTLLKDVYGEPAAVLRITTPRPVHAQANATAWLLVFALIIAGVVFTIIIMFLLEQSVLAPLARLNTAVEQIHLDRPDTDKLPVFGGKEIGGLSQAINGLLERIRSDRRLSTRLVQLRTAAEISRLISAELDLDTLLQQVVNLVETRFNFYYTGIFLVDDFRQVAVLQAGSGEAGKNMIAAGHQLALDNASMIGWCIQHKQPRIALDVGKDAVRFNNPHLPLTRSEMALPLTAGDKTIGAMTIQSSQENAFDQDDIAVLVGISDSLAIAIENAYLFRQTQENLKEIRLLHQQYLQSSWGEISRSTETLASGAAALTADACHEFPFILREQTIGRLVVEVGQRSLSDADVDFIQAVVNEVSLALENARLLEETRRNAQRDRAITEISSRVWASPSIEAIMRTTLEELSARFSVQQGEFRLILDGEELN